MGRHRADTGDKQHVDTRQQVRGQQKPGGPQLADSPKPDVSGGAAPEAAGLRPRRESRRKPREAGQKTLESRGRSAAVSAVGSAAAVEPASGAAKSTPASLPTALPGSVRRKNHDLLLWGVFLAVTAVGAMTWAEIDWRVTGAVAFLLLLSFTAVWQFSSDSPAVHDAAGQAGSEHPSPSAPVTSEPALSKSPAPALSTSTPTSQAPAPAGTVSGPAPTGHASEADPKPPITRKEMRAADPTTGVLPVVSVFARKPGAGNSRPSARPAPVAPGTKTSAATSPGVPLAPAGQELLGIDTGQAKAGSRKARRRAEAPAPVPEAAKPAQAPDSAETRKPAQTLKNSEAAKSSASSASSESSEPAESTRADKADTADQNGSGDSRWTRTFGPPETGQLPIQQYDAAAAAVVPSQPESADRRQRSHSSL